FVLDRAGLVGADGPTHHGSFDLTYLRLIPGMTVMAPKDESELRDMLYTAVEHCDGPVAIRYPRGSALGVPLKDGFQKIETGKSETLIEGEDVAFLALGKMVEYSLNAAEILNEEGISPEVINMRFAKPLDEQKLDEIASRFNKIITLEESSLKGGFGSGVLEYFAEKNYKNDILRIGLPDEFIDHGTQKELHAQLGIDAEGIKEKVKVFYESKVTKRRVTI
ncbi:MAG: transketolase C-terminal domain-containing protein, partial [Ignavibacteriaceae bacterium]